MRIRRDTHADSANSARSNRKRTARSFDHTQSQWQSAGSLSYGSTLRAKSSRMGHLAMHQKVKNIRRDPRVALSLLGYHTTQGMREYVVIYGTARVTEGGAVPLLQRLAPIYLGPGRSIRQPLCGTLRVMSPESRRHTSLGLVRGLNKPLADHESSLAPQRRLFIGAIPSPLDIRADGPISFA